MKISLQSNIACSSHITLQSNHNKYLHFSSTICITPKTVSISKCQFQSIFTYSKWCNLSAPYWMSIQLEIVCTVYTLDNGILWMKIKILCTQLLLVSNIYEYLCKVLLLEIIKNIVYGMNDKKTFCLFFSLW